MLEVQKYLKEKGVAALVKEFAIKVTDYPDRVVLNYNQIDSPRFHPICDECRALILKKDENWSVLANSFRRFYNYGEGVDLSLKVKDAIRLPSYNEQLLKSYSIKDALVGLKLDGSLLSYYFDGEKWNCATRSMAYAEGTTAFGRTFAQVFDDAAKKTNLYNITNNIGNEFLKNNTLIFELTSPETRVTTPFTETKITLLAARSNKEEDNYREFTQEGLDHLAKVLGCDRPKTYNIMCEAELLELVNYFPCMEEGVVLVWEQLNGSHIRVKCKNPAFVAISHMRNNGAISPKRILTLIMKNEQHEYLRYFNDDKKYVDFIEEEYLKLKDRIKCVYDEYKHLESQKDFAIAIMAKSVYSIESGILFTIRKKNTSVEKILMEIGADKIAKSMNLKAEFSKKFNITVEEEV